MFGELLRRLTADYTEEEYKEWLNEPSDIDAITRRYNEPIRGDEHFKDIYCDLTCVAEDTGYEPEFLINMFCESVDDMVSLGESLKYAYKHSFDYVVGVSYEQDW